MNVVDLFAGPGGWDEGVRPLGLAPLGVEWNADACATAQAAGHARLQADVAALDPQAFGTVDGLIASPPCQGFSMAGKGHGREDTVHLLKLVRQVTHLYQLQADLVELHATMADDRSLLALEPLRWALALRPSWTCWEQVPAVLPLWEACAGVLRVAGYSAVTGVLHAEQYGVPQTRKRAVLAASRVRPARLPAPTHSRFHQHAPGRLDPGLLSWVSMAAALGWGMTHRPAMTVTGGGTRTGGAEPFGNAARQGILRERNAGRWRVRDSYGTPADDYAGRRDSRWKDAATRPSPAVTGKARSWQVQPPEGPLERLTVEEAAALQTFPPGYPWQGSRSSQFQQVGNAVPPRLGTHIIAAAAGLPVPLDLGE